MDGVVEAVGGIGTGTGMAHLEAEGELGGAGRAVWGIVVGVWEGGGEKREREGEEGEEEFHGFVWGVGSLVDWLVSWSVGRKSFCRCGWLCWGGVVKR